MVKCKRERLIPNTRANKKPNAIAGKTIRAAKRMKHYS